MTLKTPTFNISEFELRNYTQPWLTPDQQTTVSETEDRVNSQLDFLAQMLGWNGPNYWTNLPATPDQKRQLLGSTFGVYNSYIIPKIYEIRNWDNKVVIDKLPFLAPGVTSRVARVVIGDETYSLESVESEGDKYVVSLGDLSQEFYDNIANNVPVKVDIPSYRPAPFYRPEVGASGDAVFTCHEVGGALSLSPGYDDQGALTYKFPSLFAGSVYYFNQPIYFSREDTLEPFVEPTYDPNLSLWFLRIPSDLVDPAGIGGHLVWAHTGATQAENLSLEVSISTWTDPSDWGSANVLNNFTGAWGNKGGPLPFNLAFDSLGIHGFNEATSIYLPPVSATLDFDDIVNYIYYQKAVVSTLAPANPKEGDVWWNDVTGAFSVWLLGVGGCGSWVEIDYRSSPRLAPPRTEITYPDVSTFRAGSGSLSVGVAVKIENFQGLDVSDNVIGIQGLLQSSGWVVIHRESDDPYWTVDEIGFSQVTDFESDAELLPLNKPVTIVDSTGLSPEGSTYSVGNLAVTLAGAYEVLLMKHYTNTTWQIYPDSLLKFIAFSSLAISPSNGELWWDFSNTDPSTRNAAIYYEGNGWVGINRHSQGSSPPSALNLDAILVYCNGSLVDPGVSYITSDFVFTYTQSATPGKYEFSYTPLTSVGRLQLPVITISDSLTTAYRADISSLIFSGITYQMTPNVIDAETPLRLWKSEALQVVETEAHLSEDNYINPLRADLNNGPGDDNWSRYFVRLPLDYGRNESAWEKVSLVCQDFAYWGSNIDPEEMRCPPEDDTPIIWEGLFIYDEPLKDYTYVYYEDYLYSNIAYYASPEVGNYLNSGVFPASDVQFDEFDEASLVDFDPLHNRQADVTSPVGQGYGDWLGGYVNVNPCLPMTGYVTTDLLSGAITPVKAPVWDASIYKYPPTCESEASSFNVDANNYKIGYAYFVADASAAEDAFFDITQEAAWRYPVDQPRTLYVTPR